MKQYSKPAIQVVHISQEGAPLCSSPINSEQDLRNYWENNGITDYDATTVKDDIYTGPLD